MIWFFALSGGALGLIAANTAHFAKTGEASFSTAIIDREKQPGKFRIIFALHVVVLCTLFYIMMVVGLRN